MALTVHNRVQHVLPHTVTKRIYLIVDANGQVASVAFDDEPSAQLALNVASSGLPDSKLSIICLDVIKYIRS